jgi:mono/diheme cytochrome c family protein
LKANPVSIVACSLLLVVTASFAQTPPTETTLTANPVYTKDCAKCHGKTAEGRHFAGPSLMNEKTAATSSENLHNIIANGKGHMPKFAAKLSPEDIDTLVRQIQALYKKP